MAKGTVAKRPAVLPRLRVMVTGELKARHPFIRAAVIGMLKAASVRRADLSLVFLSDKDMRRLNCEALGHDYVTDVITFDLSGKREAESGKQIEGEICICPGEARRNARMYAQPFMKELLRYVAHGALHLLGYEDATQALRVRMARHEDTWLRSVDGHYLH